MKRKCYLIFIVFCILGFQSCKKNENKIQGNLTFVFYNVENLFDITDQPGKNDEEFTPAGEKHWNQDRYLKKLEDLSRVLSSVNEKELPEIIGLCEVENEKVISDLKNTDKLASGNYRIVHYESPDVRGIDCALLYRPDEFQIINRYPIHVGFVDEPDYKTRDILYVKGKAKNEEEFHIFINHWPSRTGGTSESEKERIEVAALLRSKIDSVFNVNSKANIVVMGDMNLVNLMYPDDLQGKGSYHFQGEWNMLDNLIISSGLLDDEGYKSLDKKGFIFHEAWMEYKNNDGISAPNRTYGGSRYYGGVSDHFPVCFGLTL